MFSKQIYRRECVYASVVTLPLLLAVNFLVFFSSGTMCYVIKFSLYFVVFEVFRVVLIFSLSRQIAKSLLLNFPSVFIHIHN